jgi:hypothetical protein
MIIKVFKNVGKGSSRGPINYLLGKDKDGKERNLTCPLQPYQSVGERSRGLQVN